MKKIFLYLGLFFLIQTLYSQEFSFPLFFEDALGNKDTLYFGFDENATSGIDEELGEVNLINGPLDSLLYIFFTNTNIEYSSNCPVTDENVSFISKKQFINFKKWNYVELGVFKNKLPVKMSWDKEQISNINFNDITGIGDFQLVMTSFHYFNTYPDALCCGGGWIEGNIVLSDTSEYTLNNATDYSFCNYYSQYVNDTISLFYIGLMGKGVPINKVQNAKIKCYYNKIDGCIYIENLQVLEKCKIQLYDLSGRLLINNDFKVDDITVVNFESIVSGLFIFRLYNDRNDLIYSSKIVKL